MLLIMTPDQYPNYYKVLEICTGYFDSLDIMILFFLSQQYCNNERLLYLLQNKHQRIYSLLLYIQMFITSKAVTKWWAQNYLFKNFKHFYQGDFTLCSSNFKNQHWQWQHMLSLKVCDRTELFMNQMTVNKEAQSIKILWDDLNWDIHHLYLYVLVQARPSDKFCLM